MTLATQVRLGDHLAAPGVQQGAERRRRMGPRSGTVDAGRGEAIRLDPFAAAVHAEVDQRKHAVDQQRRDARRRLGAHPVPARIAGSDHPQVHAVARRQVDARRAGEAHEPVEDDVE